MRFLLQYPVGVRKAKKISAIMTNFNGLQLDLINDFFTSFLKNDYKNFEIFFVDNASTDESVEFVLENFSKDPRVKVIQNPVNNMTKGINLALKQAEGEYILFLNNDVYFAEGAIYKMVAFMDKHKDVALVQGKLVSYFDHKKIDDVGETMDLYGNPVTLGFKEKDIGQYDSQREVLSVTGAASLLRSLLLKKIGLLDEDYGIGYEDLDLSLRLRIAGYKISYLPEALTFHKRGSSVLNASEKIRLQIKYGFNKNRFATLIKNYQICTLIRSLPVVILIYLGTAILEIFYKRLWKFGLSRLCAIGWMIIDLPGLLKKRKKVQRIRVVSDKEAILPFLAKNLLLRNIRNFLHSKNW